MVAQVAGQPALLAGHHVWERIRDRLEPWERGGVLLRVKAYQMAWPQGRHAVRVHKLDTRRGTFAGSNGDEVWAILEDGAVKTVMLRRSVQPRNAEAFEVDKVHLAV